MNDPSTSMSGILDKTYTINAFVDSMCDLDPFQYQLDH